jgi:hypothetical protein
MPAVHQAMRRRRARCFRIALACTAAALVEHTSHGDSYAGQLLMMLLDALLLQAYKANIKAGCKLYGVLLHQHAHLIERRMHGF